MALVRKFKNIHGTIVLYDVDESTNNERLVTGFVSLAFCFDKDGGILHRWGEEDKIQAYFKEVQSLYLNKGLQGMADNLVIVSSDKWPLDLIDKFLGCSGYIGKWYDEELEKAKATKPEEKANGT
jgi:hypothetical protein